MTKEIQEQYKAVLRDLHERRAGYVNAINELDATISVMNRQLQTMGAMPVVANLTPVVTGKLHNDTDEARKFAKMSVRWAVLKLLAHAERPMATGEIAKALELGGVESKAERFGSIVSAVLSDMKAKKLEVESAEDGCYRLTPKGREAWEHIEQSARYRYRFDISGQGAA